MFDPRYYTLVASLPALPHFKRAERLPINRQRLEERLRLLADADSSTLAHARAVVEWGAHSANRTDAEFIRRYEVARRVTSSDFLRSILLFRVSIRTILAALRRRLRGEITGPSSSPWGTGPWIAHIERNWRSADLKLEPVFPWITPARQHLENGESAALEDLLMNIVWDNLGNIPIGREFTLDAVTAFVFKWDIIERHLAYSSPAARTRFSELGSRILTTSPA